MYSVLEEVDRDHECAEWELTRGEIGAGLFEAIYALKGAIAHAVQYGIEHKAEHAAQLVAVDAGRVPGSELPGQPPVEDLLLVRYQAIGNLCERSPRRRENSISL